jgi:hypothetical protein
VWIWAIFSHSMLAKWPYTHTRFIYSLFCFSCFDVFCLFFYSLFKYLVSLPLYLN